MMTQHLSETWRTVLSQTRAVNAAPRDGYELRIYWRVQAYRAHQNEPEPLVRAYAFASVLDNIPLHCDDAELFAGSPVCFRSPELPGNTTPVQYQQILTEHEARGQRHFTTGWDHSLADYPTLLKEGISGVCERIDRSMTEHDQPDEQMFLHSMRIMMEAFSRFAQRYADACRAKGNTTTADNLTQIAWQPPTNLQEAMQLVWLTNMVFSSESRYHMALGRIDQYLLPFYSNDIANGVITESDALSLFCHLWSKVEALGEVTNICIGGLTPQGDDATNDLSYICLDATRLVQSPHTNLSARFHDSTPEAFHRACFECIRTGVGFPAIFNDHVLLPGLEEVGIPSEVARDYCMVGCIETMLAGRQQAWSDNRFNTPLCLLSAMRRLTDESDRSYDRLEELLKEELSQEMYKHTMFIDTLATSQPADRYPDPFLSALTQDCIGRARDINDGGALYQRFIGVAIMGLATMADSLAAIKKLVFEQKAIDWQQLMDALEADFKGYEWLQQMLLNRAPKYGNDDPYVDELAAWIVDYSSIEVLKHHVSTGGRYVGAFAANVSNIYAGMEVGATPDGRNANTPLSDAASPHYYRDRTGPTAFISSVSRPDYHRALTGSVVNMKFDPEHFQGEAGADRFSAFTHAFVEGRIPELQFNFTGNEQLNLALEHPDQYSGLVVRVSGFSAYFTRLMPEVQQDILRRRAHNAGK